MVEPGVISVAEYTLQAGGLEFDPSTVPHTEQEAAAWLLSALGDNFR